MKTKRSGNSTNPSNRERWAFNLSTESLFVLGLTGKKPYAAFRMADGQLRFQPL